MIRLPDSSNGPLLVGPLYALYEGGDVSGTANWLCDIFVWLHLNYTVDILYNLTTVYTNDCQLLESKRHGFSQQVFCEQARFMWTISQFQVAEFIGFNKKVQETMVKCERNNMEQLRSCHINRDLTSKKHNFWWMCCGKTPYISENWCWFQRVL